MIDSWLFAAICLFFLAFCAVLRIKPGPSMLDRLIAINAAVTIGCGAAIALTISTGNIAVLESAIVIVIIMFAGTSWMAHTKGGAKQ
jgi:multisubunit Na+/H+ antiporter MnhF subunit